MKPLWLAILLAFGWVGPAAGQMEVFGQNKIQYNAFHWQILRGEHVELYHYWGEEELARYALALAETSVLDLARRFRRETTEPIPLVLYSSHHHFQETNLVPYFLPEGVAGFTEFFRGRVALPFVGSYAELAHVIRHEMVHVFQRAELAEIYRLHPRADFPPPPEWLTEGLAEYWSGEPSPAQGMVLRDLTLHQELPTVQELEGASPTFPLYALGQSLVSFISAEYGEDRLLLFYESLWREPTFAAVLELVLAAGEEELTRDWHRQLQERYFPLAADHSDVAVEAELLVGGDAMARMPTVASRSLGKGLRSAGEETTRAEESSGELIYFSSRGGNVSVHGLVLEREERRERVILQGEREERFESFHPGQSRMDVSSDGRLAVVSKVHDRDAIYLVDLAGQHEDGPFYFADLIGISSPSWSPDASQLVFSALSWDGYADLYVLRPATGALERLTRDRYLDRDPDWSPDGRRIVFSSDRGRYGDEGFENLWLFSLEDYGVRPLSRGRWNDSGPRWSPDGQTVLFTSDRDGVPDLWLCDTLGGEREISRYLTGVLEADWTPDGTSVVFTAYRDGRLSIYRQAVTPGEWAVPPGTAAPVSAPPPAPSSAPAWSWPELPGPAAPLERYRPRYGLDLAQGEVVYGLGGGHAEGMEAYFSDPLNDRLLRVQFSHAGESFDELFSRLSLGVTYINLGHRLHYGFGAFHYVGDTIDRRGFPFFERRAGAHFVGSYPFSRYHRMESGFLLAHSDKSVFPEETRRRRMIGTSYLALVRDTSQWGSTGPVYGDRLRLALGATMDLTHAQPENLVLVVDGRHYLRLGERLTLASRCSAGLSRGSDPEIFLLGGSWNLRGYRRNSLLGTRSFLASEELRFPLVAPFRIQFPPARLSLPPIQGALFVDAGNAWDKGESLDSLVGSLGGGVRMGLAQLTALRLDVSWRTDFHRVEPHAQVDFFFGWDF